MWQQGRQQLHFQQFPHLQISEPRSSLPDVKPAASCDWQRLVIVLAHDGYRMLAARNGLSTGWLSVTVRRVDTLVDGPGIGMPGA